MTDIDFRKIGEIAVKNCEPLYLSNLLLSDGHTADKANATITYVKYNNEIYGITCAHVYDLQISKLGEFEKILSVWGRGRLVFHFGGFGENGYQSDFRVLKNIDICCDLDIAIIKLPSVFLETHMKSKGKISIDLDQWQEPDWESISTLVVSGFPTEHKEESETTVSANFMQVVAELTAPLKSTTKTFMLASTLPEKNNFFFSGVSGGPVYCIKPDHSIGLIGIVFEGSPGSSAEWKKRGESSFFSMEDVQFRVYLLTPDIFSNWIKSVGLS